MKKFTALLYLIFLSPNIVFGEPIEIHIIDQLDEHRGYCLDIKGYKLKAKVNQGLQAHTCYSYQGAIAVDQGFDPIKLIKNEFYLPAFAVCMEAKSLSASAPLRLRECNYSKLQQFTWDKSGRIQTTNEQTFCLTMAQGESQKGRGGSPVHQKRNLTLETCSKRLKKFQLWGARKNNSKS